MSTEDPNYLQYIWMIFAAPIAFLYQKIYSLRKELSEVKATQEYKKADLEYVKTKLDAMNNTISHIEKSVAKLCGTMEEHLRK